MARTVKKHEIRREELVDLPLFMNAKEVAKLFGFSESSAYKLMQKLNKELQGKGKITVCGRISSKYLIERAIY